MAAQQSLQRGTCRAIFPLDEAIALATAANIPSMTAHHYGMFEFNTLPRATIEQTAAQPDLVLSLLPASLGIEYRLLG
jgi:hypothetical protein